MCHIYRIVLLVSLLSFLRAESRTPQANSDDSEEFNVCESRIARKLNEFMGINPVFQPMPENLQKNDGSVLGVKNNGNIYISEGDGVFSPINSTHSLSKRETPTKASTSERVGAVLEHDDTPYNGGSDQHWKILSIVSQKESYYPSDPEIKKVPISTTQTDRDLICSNQEHASENLPMCCMAQPRSLVKELGPYALFRRYGMRKVEFLNVCEVNFDVIAVARNRTFMFIGKYMYSSAQREFMLIRDAYPALPENLTKIDAYVFSPNGFEYFYIGRNVYIIPDTESIPVRSVNLTALRFSEEIDHVNAVFYYNGAMITVVDDQYWLCDIEGKAFMGPFDIGNFNGPQLPVTTGFGEFEGKSYIVYDGRHIMPIDKDYTRNHELDQQYLVCNPDVLERRSPPTCCRM